MARHWVSLRSAHQNSINTGERDAYFGCQIRSRRKSRPRRGVDCAFPRSGSRRGAFPGRLEKDRMSGRNGYRGAWRTGSTDRVSWVGDDDDFDLSKGQHGVREDVRVRRTGIPLARHSSHARSIRPSTSPSASHPLSSISIGTPTSTPPHRFVPALKCCQQGKIKVEKGEAYTWRQSRDSMAPRSESRPLDR